MTRETCYNKALEETTSPGPQLSVAGKIAARKGVSGRPRLPDDQVKPNTLHQREHRARLKAKSAVRKGRN
jgi:hypothetical protein